ncbi:hypothetical protein [uncultured Campylobacter sp.]|nr:hypothetical protein [uncultured Campylobacter sp.]
MKILLINGGEPFNGEGGKLSKTLHELAKKTLQALGHEKAAYFYMQRRR